MKKHTLNALTWVRLMRFSNTSNQLSNEFLKRYDLTSSQFDVLLQIHSHEPLTQSELATKIVVTQAGISRMLTRLEKDGLITRQPNWKIKLISLTAKGRAKIEQAMAPQIAFQSSFFEEALSAEEQKELYRLMTKLQKHSSKKTLPPQ